MAEYTLMKKKLSLVAQKSSRASARQPSRAEAEQAVRTLIEFIGEDPEREGVRETPKRVVKAFEEYFRGYKLNVEEILSKTFKEVGTYDGPVLIRDITLESRCEHHLAPFLGHAHIAYIPDGRVLGLSKLPRLVNAYASRMQTQERLTAEIADALDKYLKPKGVAVLIEAEHYCMKLRGVNIESAKTVTTRFLGAYKKDAEARETFLKMVRG
jgi:GTP cyclohydrolase I